MKSAQLPFHGFTAETCNRTSLNDDSGCLHADWHHIRSECCALLLYGALAGVRAQWVATWSSSRSRRRKRCRQHSKSCRNSKLQQANT